MAFLTTNQIITLLYKKYLKNAENFIKSKKFFKYTTDFDALNIVKEINNLCKN
jgi:alanine-alpha-ketoisovalerate/valine-pyruvate aminotransferase